MSFSVHFTAYKGTNENVADSCIVHDTGIKLAYADDIADNTAQCHAGCNSSLGLLPTNVFQHQTVRALSL